MYLSALMAFTSLLFMSCSCVSANDSYQSSALSKSTKENSSYFPADYDTSRERFRSRANAFKELLSSKGMESQIGSFQLPNSPRDDLSVDYYYIAPKGQGKRLFVLASGVHGPEAYAGSAIQELFFSEYLPKWIGDKNISKETGILIIHSLNPWGFKHHRRGTQNSINLNRNFAFDETVFETENPDYESVKEIISPQSKVACIGRKPLKLKLTAKLASIQVLSDVSLEIALGQGQYHYPKGVTYGGAETEPQTKFFKDLLDNTLDGYEVGTEVIAYDLHTGLGERDQLHLIISETADKETVDFWSELFKEGQKKGEFILTNPINDHGFYPTAGDFNEFVEQIAQSKKMKARSITVEFGTVGTGTLGQLFTAQTLILENQGYHFGYGNEKCKQNVSKDYLSLFYPSRIAWKESVIKKSRSAIFALEQYLKK